ncbi:MAG: hypothetical protein OEO17_05230, partial [Gemmatimonadota bacterium]|nr:hypothetical protein [Gemmatimonadota bacterium]
RGRAREVREHHEGGRRQARDARRPDAHARTREAVSTRKPQLPHTNKIAGEGGTAGTKRGSGAAFPYSSSKGAS